MMPKKKFYSLCRYVDKTDGNIKVDYLPGEGADVPNNLGFDLAVYRATDKSVATNYREVKIWFVVDTRTGLSVAEGGTKKEAVENALNRLKGLDMELYNTRCAEFAKTYGPCPGHNVMYNLCSS